VNLIELGRGFVRSMLPRFSRDERRVVQGTLVGATELKAPPGSSLEVEDIPDRPRPGRRSRPFGNYWDHLGYTLGSRLINPDNLSVENYRMMVDEDETVSSAIEFTTLNVVEAFGVYHNTNRRARNYEEQLWAQCQDSLAGYLREALTALWAGYSVAERVYHCDGSKLWLDQLPVIDPAGVDFVMETDRTSRRYGRVAGVAHRLMALDEPIGIESLAIYSHNSLFGNPWGRSRCKSMFPNWVSKKALFLQWGRTLERYGTPTSIGKSQNLQQLEEHWEKPDQQATRGENLLDMLERLHETGQAALPTDIELVLIEAKAALGEDFERAQNHFNKCILRGLLIPALLFEPTDIGSFALGQKHFEIFMSSVHMIADELRRIVLRYIIGPLLRWNFGTRIPIGEYRAPKLLVADQKLWAEIFFSMANAGFIRKDLQEDANVVRDRLGFPLWEEMPAPAPVEPVPSGAPGEGLPGDKAPDGRGGLDPGFPSPTPQAPSKPQGRRGAKAKRRNGR
jgi:hypothetical protein